VFVARVQCALDDDARDAGEQPCGILQVPSRWFRLVARSFQGTTLTLSLQVRHAPGPFLSAWPSTMVLTRVMLAD
jgi:hypothetical protein